MADKGRKRKTVSRGSASQTRNPEYVSNKFRSLGCEKFHDSFPEKAKFVKEKAIFLAPGEFEEIRQNISNRGWEQYVSYPKDASMALVFEFFSNIFPKEAVDGPLKFPVSTSYVRGRTVPFNEETINELFGLAPVTVLDCLFKTKISKRKVQENPERAEEIRQALCNPGMDWVRNQRGEPQKILTSSLTPVARGWAAFIVTNIYPSPCVSELSLERAVLASCIVRGEPVNLGWILENELKSFAKFTDGLPSYWKYASLIALLCEKAGVIADADEATVSPTTTITGSWISRVGLGQPIQREEPPLEHPVQREEPQQEEPDDLGPTFSMDDIPVGPSMADFQELQARMDVLATSQEQLTANPGQMTTTLESIKRKQARMAAEYRFGMRSLYRAMCMLQCGGQLDTEADIFPPPPPPR